MKSSGFQSWQSNVTSGMVLRASNDGRPDGDIRHEVAVHPSDANRAATFERSFASAPIAQVADSIEGVGSMTDAKAAPSRTVRLYAEPHALANLALTAHL
jgi:hypothetical protein